MIKAPLKVITLMLPSIYLLWLVFRWARWTWKECDKTAEIFLFLPKQDWNIGRSIYSSTRNKSMRSSVLTHPQSFSGNFICIYFQIKHSRFVPWLFPNLRDLPLFKLSQTPFVHTIRFSREVNLCKISLFDAVHILNLYTLWF